MAAPLMAMMAFKQAIGTFEKYNQMEMQKQSLLQSAIDDGVRAEETAKRFEINRELMESRGKALASRQALAFAKGNVSVSSGVGFTTQVNTMQLVYESVAREQRKVDFELHQLYKGQASKFANVRKLNEAQLITILSGGMAAGYGAISSMGGSSDTSSGNGSSVDKSALQTLDADATHDMGFRNA